MVVVTLVLAVGLMALLAAVLGVMRESVILRGEVKALASLITKPPAPSFLGKAVPDLLAKRLLSAWSSSPDELESRDSYVVAFLTADCSGCSALVSDLATAVKSGVLTSEFVVRHLAIVLAAHDEESFLSLAATASDVAGSVISDADSQLSQACEIRQTPTLMQVRMPDAVVMDYRVGGGIEWIRNVLLQPTRTTLTLS